MKQLEIKKFFKNHAKEKIDDIKKNEDLKNELKFLFNNKSKRGTNSKKI
tara:strand:+ start:33 stop:179 length:147 start_codon:yes stop_codon:yes gene_type:complete